MVFQTLDVGCSGNLRGDVNIDIVKPFKKYREFILADALYLPIKDNGLPMIYCFHLIEHIANPILLIRELLRATKGAIEIRCPYRLSWYAKSSQHRNYFCGSWFHAVLKHFRVRTYVTLDIYRSIWRFPLELVVEIRKR